MGIGQYNAMHMFGRPRGVLGRLGGVIMARTNTAHGCGVAKRLQVRTTDYVLEVGFGSGAVIQCLTCLAAKGHVAGVDPSAVMVTQGCSRNAAAIARGQVELVRGSADNLPFDEDVFDRGMTINSMQVWPDAHAGLREILRVLKPGGRFAFGFTRSARQRTAGLTETLTDAGFANAQLSATDAGFYVLTEKPWGVVAESVTEPGVRQALAEPNA
jgi:ubiquinone/menaquinone biosynthesis C-methylase UbiE